MNQQFNRWATDNPRNNRILFAIDLDNLGLNIPAETTSLKEALDGAIRYMARIGRIVKMYAFGPPGTLQTHEDVLQRREFIPVWCPKIIIDKEGALTDKTDTVDPKLMKVCFADINEMPNLTHFALGSGDGHFEKLALWAQEQGLKIIVIAGDRKSLNPRIMDVASCDADGNRMVYFMTPGENR